MANSLKSNPITIDTVAADVDISAGHTEVTDTTMYIEAVRFEGSTAADVVVLKDTAGNKIVSQTSPVGGGDLDRIDLDGFPAQGLKVLAADCTITSGNFLIWLR